MSGSLAFCFLPLLKPIHLPNISKLSYGHDLRQSLQTLAYRRSRSGEYGHWPLTGRALRAGAFVLGFAAKGWHEPFARLALGSPD